MDKAVLETELRNALGAHGIWKLKLRTALNTGSCDSDPATVARDDCCAFGKWLYGDGFDDQTKDGMPYKVVTRLHAEFHKTAAKVIERVKSGQMEAAHETLNGDFALQSKKLTLAIAKWRGELKGH